MPSAAAPSGPASHLPCGERGATAARVLQPWCGFTGFSASHCMGRLKLLRRSKQGAFCPAGQMPRAEQSCLGPAPRVAAAPTPPTPAGFGLATDPIMGVHVRLSCSVFYPAQIWESSERAWRMPRRPVSEKRSRDMSRDSREEPLFSFENSLHTRVDLTLPQFWEFATGL